MAKTKISEYDSTASNNTDLDSINLSEGVMTPSSLNDAHRMQMAHLKDFSDGTSGIDVLNLQDDDGSASIKLQAPSAVTTTTTLTLPDGDGSSGQVLSTDGSGSLSWSAAMPKGVLSPYAGSTAPSGWLLCYGQAISRTTYAALFAVVGTTYGVGDGSTTFNIPDLRGNVIAGQDDMGGVSADRLTSPINGDTLGASGGSESHALTEAELAEHSHLLLRREDVGGREFLPDLTEAQGADRAVSAKAVYANNAAYSMGYSDAGNEANIGKSSSVGSGTAHNNVQPTIILNYIIKT